MSRNGGFPKGAGKTTSAAWCGGVARCLAPGSEIEVSG